MKRIIMIDDDQAILDIYTLVFERSGYAITTYTEGQVLLDNSFTEPDLFIIDKQISGVDGLDLCRHLKTRKTDQKTPVIIFSATPRLGEQARAAGADDFIEKPFRTKELMSRVEKLID